MSATSEAIIRIDSRTADMAADITAISKEQERQRCDIDALKLARARLDGQLDILYKIVLFFGFTGIVALIKAFATTP